jgi:hypothetical protein
MELCDALLAGACLSVISSEPDPELDRLARIVAPSARVSGRAELDATAAGSRTLDLLGHSTARGHLRLGDWVIDGADPEVAAWCRGLAGRGALVRLGISAVRLLGCCTAGTADGRATVVGLAALLGVEVHGATQLLHAGHYDERGFRDAWRFLLVASSTLGALGAPAPRAAASAGEPGLLDLAALPALAPAPGDGRWPRRVAPPEVADEILRLVRRDAGAPMPGHGPLPSCELALPSSIPGTYHLAEVLLDGAFLRFFPDPGAPGVAYPVDDVPALNRLLGGLAAGDVTA